MVSIKEGVQNFAVLAPTDDKSPTHLYMWCHTFYGFVGFVSFEESSKKASVSGVNKKSIHSFPNSELLQVCHMKDFSGWVCIDFSIPFQVLFETLSKHNVALANQNQLRTTTLNIALDFPNTTPDFVHAHSSESAEKHKNCRLVGIQVSQFDSIAVQVQDSLVCPRCFDAHFFFFFHGAVSLFRTGGGV
eukprot:NODE_799_length_1186_cov_47.500472_g758_i0.p1 GENE.NODE_799_length_1186_cov_47.500472_g758_i0~~NODE_799_length_1186_cov_47.500472_g758_i0.p1  ORF type:complete len:189 (+),score=27.71 NODE_799_length_1186_cov_47.500472_g758_i0:457-1023(+)